jgi:hypothetical protein
MNALGASEVFTIDPGGANETILAFSPEPPPAWDRAKAIIVIPRNVPFALPVCSKSTK